MTMSNDDYEYSAYSHADDALDAAQAVVHEWLVDAVSKVPLEVRKALLLINAIREHNDARAARIHCVCKGVIKGKVDVALLVDISECDETESELNGAVNSTCTKH